MTTWTDNHHPRRRRTDNEPGGELLRLLEDPGPPDPAESAEERCARALVIARAAFFAALARAFPEAGTGDLDALSVLAFDRASERAARAWVLWNLPQEVSEE